MHDILFVAVNDYLPPFLQRVYCCHGYCAYNASDACTALASHLQADQKRQETLVKPPYLIISAPPFALMPRVPPSKVQW